MAYNNIVEKIYLGFEDESISEKYKSIIDFKTNKIGGKPDWPFTENQPNVICPLCGLNELLVLQIHAPLENSAYLRTLYIFACINVNCWNQNESWTCLRSQIIDNSKETDIKTSTKAVSTIEWCQDADDWDDANDNISEENGNIINRIDACGDRKSDDEDESCSFEDSLRAGFEELFVDNKNANKALVEAQGGAVGRLHSPTATAEIEGDEGEVVSIDTPTVPQHNLIALLQEAAPLPVELCQQKKSGKNTIMNLQFASSFISVSLEENNTSPIPQHVRDLLNEYQSTNESVDFMHEASGEVQGDMAVEKYEKSVPVHGDNMLHHLISKIQMNPGQIIRYSRDGATPLLLSPLNEVPKKCNNCNGNMIFELQVLPTLIPKLHLCSITPSQVTHLEFGTVLIFTCQTSCWTHGDTVKQEAVIVQSERF